jgi:hypothetical protein
MKLTLPLVGRSIIICQGPQKALCIKWTATLNFTGHFVAKVGPSKATARRLGGVVVSVLATGSKGRGYKPGWGDGFLRAVKSAAHLHSHGKQIWSFTACKRSVDVSKILNTRNSHSFVHFSYSLQMSLLVRLPKSSGRQVRSYPQPASPRLPRSHSPGGKNNRPGMAAVLRCQPHPT